MIDKYKMDGHKLHWHLDRVRDWQEGKRIVPIHIDVGLSKGCNIHCEYCFGSTQGNYYKKGAKIYFPRESLLRYMRDAGKAGVRSMAFIGEGEPTLNPALYEAIKTGTKAGVDISLGTNGILFDNGPKGEEALEYLKWIRFNISAASYKSYARIHGSKSFLTACKKIRFCVDTKVKKKLKLTLGLQMVLTPKNFEEALPLAHLGKELGVDYLVIKQCSDTPENYIGYYKRLGEYDMFTDILKKAESQSTNKYSVVIKWSKISNKGNRDYDQCLGVPFLLYSSGEGRLYPCGIFFEFKEKEYRMGDLTKQSFLEIVKSDRYWEIVEKVKKIDVHNKCYSNCRTHCINEHLWDLKHPPDHVNFI